MNKITATNNKILKEEKKAWIECWKDRTINLTNTCSLCEHYEDYKILNIISWLKKQLENLEF